MYTYFRKIQIMFGYGPTSLRQKRQGTQKHEHDEHEHAFHEKLVRVGALEERIPSVRPISHRPIHD